MPTRFNPPPNWPRPPEGWAPEQGWRPDPAWGPPPPGWAFWVEEPVVRGPGPAGPARSGGPRVFISYRRSDCQPQANGLHDGLSHRLPAASIFMDIDSIPPGADFEQHIRSEIEICDLLLVLIGDNWLDTPDPVAGRRIDAPDDFVRLEIESALASPQVRVLPVLVEGASMPRAVDLPPSIRSLARFNAVELDDRRWTGDIRRLTATIEELTGVAATRPQSTPAPAGGGPAGPDVVDGGRPAPPGRTSAIGWLMVFLPLLSAGLANFAPALWASRRRPEPRVRRQLLVFAIVVGLVTFSMIGIIGAAPEGTLSTVAVLVWWLCIAVAIVVAVVNRRSAVDLPGGAEELQRRRRRAQYRALAQRDPALARHLRVGRPDLARAQDDGGLLDLNALPAEALAHWGAIAAEDARRIVQARQYRSRLSGLVDLAGTGLSAATLARLRETAVFL